MKGILVIVDGMGDLPNKQLGNKTPLEAANMPNADFLAARGELGYMYPVKPGFIPESDEALVSLFGNDLISSTRGRLEAAGAGLNLIRGDLALRANFATIDDIKKGNIIDRRVGRNLTNAEAEILTREINNKIKLPVNFLFKHIVAHRAVLVLKGGFSDNISGNDYMYIQGRANLVDKIGVSKPLDDDENSQYTANILNEFAEKAYEILKEHPINEARKRKGLLPANFILFRDGGIENPRLKKYKNWAAVINMPLEVGFSKLSGMKVFSFEVPRLKKLDIYESLYHSLRRICKVAVRVLKRNRKKVDYVYIHLKETDVPGHDNKPFEKKEMLEYIDRTLFNFLRKFAPPNNINVVITADHSTPCRLKTHSADPVPVLFYNHSIPKEKKFCESEARKGKLGRINGQELLGKVGFLK